MLRVQGLVFRVHCLDFLVQGLEFTVEEFKV